MSRRGGSGRNQGRKELVGALGRALIGQRCEDMQQEDRLKAARDRYEAQHNVKVLRNAQAMLRGDSDPDDGELLSATIDVDGEYVKVTTPEQADRFITDQTFLKGRRSTVSLTKLSPKRKTRKEICQAVAHELGGISRDTVDKYWKELRRSLIATRLSTGPKS